MEPTTMGIENSNDIILFISELAKTFKEANQDGSIDLMDALKSMRLLPTLAAAIKGADQIKDELMDLNGEEKDLLLVALKTAIYDLVDAFT
jgi:hypothetical protein